MSKRKMFKRALPIILSVAMTFQSVPTTALAAEGQAVEETVQDERAVSDSAGEDAGNTSGSDTADDDKPTDADSGAEASEPMDGNSLPVFEENDSAKKDEEQSADVAPAAADTPLTNAIIHLCILQSCT